MHSHSRTEHPRKTSLVRPSPRWVAAIALWSLALGAMPAIVHAGGPETPITLEQAAGAGPGWPIRFFSLGDLLELSPRAGTRSRWTAPMSTARLNPVSLNRHGEVRLFETANWPRPGIQHGFGPYAGTRFDRFSLYHNSTALWSNDALGPGWSHWGDIQVHTWREAMGVSRAAVLWGNGSVQLFEREANLYRSLDPYRDTLSKERGQFVLTLKSGMVLRFQNVRGVPTKSVVASLEDPNGNTMTFAYDALGRLTRITDPHGRTLDLVYSPDGRLSQVVYAFAGAVRVCDLTYDGGELRTVERPFVTTVAPAAVTRGAEARLVERFELPPVSRDSTTFDHDTLGNIVSETDALGNTKHYDYLGNRLMQALTALGNVKRFEWLPGGRRKVIDARDVETELTFGLHGLAEVVDGAGAPWKLEYMDARYPHGWSKLTFPLGDTVKREYDESANPIVYIDRMNNEWKSSYDASNRLSRVEAPLVSTHTERATTSYAYDAAGNVLEIRQNAGGGAERVTSYTYDAAGNRTSRTDTGGGTTTYQYDALGHLIEMIDPVGRTFEWEYQSAETTNLFVRPDHIRTGEGDLILHRYNQYGQRVGTQTPTETFVYGLDVTGRLVEMRDPTGVTVLSYDAGSRVTSEVKSADPTAEPPPPSYTGVFEYEPNGLLESIALPGAGRTIRYEYDDANRLTSTVDGAVAQQRRYDGENRLVRVENSNGTSTEWERDRGVVERITHYDATGSPFADYLMQYDEAGNLVQTTELDGSATLYGYDLLRRLIFEERSDAAGSTSSYDNRYEHDERGDRVTAIETHGPTTLEESSVYEDDGKPVETAVTTGPCSTSSLAARTHVVLPCEEQPIGWDGNGNLSAYTPPGEDPLLLLYDALGRRDGFEQGGLAGSALHDGLGRGVAERRGDELRQVIWRWGTRLDVPDFTGGRRIPETPIQERTGSGQVTDHTIDPSGNLVASTVEGSPLFLHRDPQGFFRFLTDLSGVIAHSQPPRNGNGELTDGASSSPIRYVADGTRTTVGDLLDIPGVGTYSPSLGMPASDGAYAHGRESGVFFYPLPGDDSGLRPPPLAVELARIYGLVDAQRGVYKAPAGSQSWENLFLVNGVAINENIRGEELPLFIEDSIQETTTQVSGVSAPR